MTSSDEARWEAGTWEGSRRAMLRRALQRTVRERLETLEALTETSERLTRIGRRQDRVGGDDGRNEGA